MKSPARFFRDNSKADKGRKGSAGWGETEEYERCLQKPSAWAAVGIDKVFFSIKRIGWW